MPTTRRRRTLASVLALCAGLATVTAASAAARKGPPDLSGHWRLNRDESEDARAKLRESWAGRRSSGLRGPTGGRTGGPLGGAPIGRGPVGGGPAGGRGANTDSSAAVRDFVDAPETLAITQTGEELAFEDGEGVLRIRPDGRKVKREGGEVEVKARWSGEELVVESERRDGPKLITTYTVGSDRRHLHVTSRLEGQMGDVTVRRVYDAVESP